MLQLAKKDRVILGVCGGFAELTSTPAVWWRLGFLLAFLLFGVGVFVYLAAAAFCLVIDWLSLDEFEKPSDCGEDECDVCECKKSEP